MGIFRSLYVVVCFYISLCVLVGPSVSLLALSVPYKFNASLCVLIEPSRSYRVIRGLYKSLCVFMGPFRSL